MVAILGSLIWTWDGTRAPVGLLFAGGRDYTFASKIGHVLQALGSEAVHLKCERISHGEIKRAVMVDYSSMPESGLVSDLPKESVNP